MRDGVQANEFSLVSASIAKVHLGRFKGDERTAAARVRTFLDLQRH